MDDILSLRVTDFLSATAAKTPTPGGGSVAALCGALAAALGAMAMEFTVGKKAYAAHDAQTRAALKAFQTASENLQELVVEDIAAYEGLSPLLKLPAEQRQAHPDYLAAVVAAVRVPQTVAVFGLSVLDQCAAVLETTNKFLVGDLGIAAVYAHATVHAGELMVRANLPLLPNQAEAAEMRSVMEALAAKADRKYAAFRAELLQRV
jgi:formiminotetrahydrofolate cyclodeaminase